MKILYIDKKREFIFFKLKVFYKKKDITLKYAILYISKKNKLAKKKSRIIITMKNSLFLDNGLPLDFWAETLNIVSYL